MSVIQQEADHKFVKLCEYYYTCAYKECEAIRGQLALWIRRRNSELVLVEKERHYDTHQVNNDEKDDGFCCHDVWRP